MKANMRASSEAYWALKKHRYEQGKIQQAVWADQMTKQFMAVNNLQARPENRKISFGIFVNLSFIFAFH